MCPAFQVASLRSKIQRWYASQLFSWNHQIFSTRCAQVLGHKYCPSVSLSFSPEWDGAFRKAADRITQRQWFFQSEDNISTTLCFYPPDYETRNTGIRDPHKSFSHRPCVAQWLEHPLGVREVGVRSPTASHQRRKNKVGLRFSTVGDRTRPPAPRADALTTVLHSKGNIELR